MTNREFSKVLCPACSDERFEEAFNDILERSFLFNKTTKTLYIKNNGEPLRLSSPHFKAGSNIRIELSKDESEATIYLEDNIDVDSVTISPEDSTFNWKGGQIIGRLTKNRILLLFKKNNEGANAIIGGESMIDINDGEFYDHHNISFTSSGSRAYLGATENEAKSQLVQVRIKGTDDVYYGIQIPPIITKAWTEYREVEYEDPVYAEHSYTSETLRVSFNYYQGGNPLHYYKDWYSLTLGDSASTIGMTRFSSSQYEAQDPLTMFSKCSAREFFQKFIKIDGQRASSWMDFKNFGNLYQYLEENYNLWITHTRKTYAQNQATALRHIYLAPYEINPTYKSDGSGTSHLVGAIDITSLFTSNGLLFPNMTTTVNTNMGVFVNAFSLTKIAYDYIHHYETKTRIDEIEHPEVEGIPDKAVVYFNGWYKVPSSLRPPEKYSDSDFEEVYPLVAEADSATVEQTLVVLESDPNSVANYIEQCTPNGADADPHILHITGTLTKTMLNNIAEALRAQPDRQVLLDFRNAYCTTTGTEKCDEWNWAIFSGCTSLREIYLPKNLINCSKPCFTGCVFLRKIHMLHCNRFRQFGYGGYAQNDTFFSQTRVLGLIYGDSAISLGDYTIGASSISNIIIKTDDFGCDWSSFKSNSSMWDAIIGNWGQTSEVNLLTPVKLFVTVKCYEHIMASTDSTFTAVRDGVAIQNVSDHWIDQRQSPMVSFFVYDKNQIDWTDEETVINSFKEKYNVEIKF